MNRLSAQADEAELLGLKKTATNLKKQVAKNSTRETAADYIYTHADLEQDVHACLWDAVVRAADYYGAGFDAKKAQEIVEQLATDLVDGIRITSGIADGVGAYEPKVPGEEDIAIEVKE